MVSTVVATVLLGALPAFAAEGDVVQVEGDRGTLLAAIHADRLVVESAGAGSSTGRPQRALVQVEVEVEIPGLAEITALVPASVAELAGPDAGTPIRSRTGAGVEAWLAAGSRRLADGRTELVLLRGDGGSTGLAPRAERLALPEAGRPGVRVRRRPILLVDRAMDSARGRWVGIAWLEGDTARSHEVWAAEVTADGFGRPERVAAAGPGSQLGLVGDVLPDGSWLLAWSAYDGEDDEILVRRRASGVWGAPRPITDNAVPDVTPALQATDTGALVAWSGFEDGSYRIRTRALVLSGAEGAEWRPARDPLVGAESGDRATRGLFPGLVRTRSGLALRWLGSRPRSWQIARVDASGEAIGVAGVESVRRSAPAVLEAATGDSERLEVRWPASRERAALSESVRLRPPR